jgi:Meckelin (Transmembrane protein 67)
LHLRAARYNLEGQLLEIESGGANLLTLCPTADEELGLRFGARYHVSCLISARKLMALKTVFQDFYIEAFMADGTDRLYPIPILVRNLKGNQVIDKTVPILKIHLNS